MSYCKHYLFFCESHIDLKTGSLVLIKSTDVSGALSGEYWCRLDDRHAMATARHKTSVNVTATTTINATVVVENSSVLLLSVVLSAV